WFRTNPMWLSPLVVQLLGYPAGKFLAAVLPHGFMNPGPFNIKEHVLISLTANVCASPAYAIDITVIQKVWYNEDFGFLPNFLLVLCTQMVGYGMAGVLRRYLVYPSAMVWPATLVNVALLNTLHKDEDLEPGQWSRYKFFVIAAIGMFCYNWLPGYIFPVLSSFAWICWFNKESILHAQVFGARGMGLGVIALDWNQIVSYLGSPLVVPWWAEVNILVGAAFVALVMTPIAYYTNLWDAQKFQMFGSKLYRVDGTSYNTKEVMDSTNQYDEAKGAMLGTLMAGLMNLSVASWLLNSQPGICTSSKDFGCPSANVFYSASVIWGVIAPDRMFGPKSIYNIINYFFFIGFLLPIPFYLLKKKFPNTWVELIHIPVILNATGMMPPASPFHYWNWVGVGFAFQFFLRRYRTSWYMRFNYITSAAFDTGTAFFALLVFFALQMHEINFPTWWGNPAKSHCPLDGQPTIKPPPEPVPAA
ncbi:hypothetical protein DFQ26_000956, partial [Actinomortierella ambigua]